MVSASLFYQTMAVSTFRLLKDLSLIEIRKIYLDIPTFVFNMLFRRCFLAARITSSFPFFNQERPFLAPSVTFKKGNSHKDIIASSYFLDRCKKIGFIYHDLVFYGLENLWTSNKTSLRWREKAHDVANFKSIK